MVKCSSGGGTRLSKYQGNRKVHQCPYCPYTSHFITNYKRHVYTHTGEKPFACPHCTYRSNSNNHLKRHMNTHRGDFACDRCSYATQRRSVLESHMLTEHDFHYPIPPKNLSEKCYFGSTVSKARLVNQHRPHSCHKASLSCSIGQHSVLSTLPSLY
ncbi:RE1-silencing transcription factor [Chionoecetes opilio]|uniref:RE1-silencing transcription factor n=1 Tax=Chionoecetes opilio TaxID=41210 RepID=A0A8J5CC19_CHIOP|nr:RE1-silencing transcription factor [Chionoecetes opilio]